MSIDDRPSMKMDDHPDHNMPEPEHDGVQLAGDVVAFPSAASNVMPETTRVKNMISEQNMRITGTKPGSNVVKIPDDRYK